MQKAGTDLRDLRRRAWHAVELLVGDGTIEGCDHLSGGEFEFRVLEGGYEPARIRARVERDGTVSLRYR